MAGTIEVDAPDASNTSEITGPISDEATVQMSAMEQKCTWNGQEFSGGDRVTNGGKCYECAFGRWVEIED